MNLNFFNHIHKTVYKTVYKTTYSSLTSCLVFLAIFNFFVPKLLQGQSLVANTYNHWCSATLQVHWQIIVLRNFELYWIWLACSLLTSYWSYILCCCFFIYFYCCFFFCFSLFVCCCCFCSFWTSWKYNKSGNWGITSSTTLVQPHRYDCHRGCTRPRFWGLSMWSLRRQGPFS